jgi:hypothetical protein
MLRNYYINKEWIVSYTAACLSHCSNSIFGALLLFDVGAGYGWDSRDSPTHFEAASVCLCPRSRNHNGCNGVFLVWLRQLVCIAKGILVLCTVVPATRTTSVLLHRLLALRCAQGDRERTCSSVDMKRWLWPIRGLIPLAMSAFAVYHARRRWEQQKREAAYHLALPSYSEALGPGTTGKDATLARRTSGSLKCAALHSTRVRLTT